MGGSGIWDDGGTEIHAEFNVIEQCHRNQRHNRVERLRRVVMEHLTKSSPQNVVALPPTKHGKLE